MKELIDMWDPTKSYGKLQLVIFMDKFYQSTVDNNEGVLPIIPRQLDSPILSIDDQELIDSLIEEYGNRNIEVTQNSIVDGKYKWIGV